MAHGHLWILPCALDPRDHLVYETGAEKLCLELYFMVLTLLLQGYDFVRIMFILSET